MILYVYTYTCDCICTHMMARVYVFIHDYICMCIYTLYMFAYVCMYNKQFYFLMHVLAVSHSIPILGYCLDLPTNEAKM